MLSQPEASLFAPARRLLSATVCAAAAATCLVVSAPAAQAAPLCTLVGSAQIPMQGPGVGTNDLLSTWPEGSGPDVVEVRGTQVSFNRRYEFALDGGNVVTRPRGSADAWRLVPLPACLAGKVSALSADDDEVVLIGTDGFLYTLDRVSSHPVEWNVSSLWGAPFWWGAGRALPPTWDGGWALTVNNRNFDGHYRDAAGRAHPVGAGRMTMVAALVGDGSDILMLDPWLPNDDSYRVPSPQGGQFQATQLSASASSIVVANDRGEMYVRSWDFDRAGSDTVFFRYHWDRRTHLPAAPTKFQETFNPAYAANHLPVPDWSRLPAIPGRITKGLSIDTPSPRERVISVPGLSAQGEAGVWRMRLAVDDIELGTITPQTARWEFVPTPGAHPTAELANAADATAPVTGPRGPRLQAQVHGQPLTIEHFDLRTDRLPARWGEKHVTLHIVDGLRLGPNSRDLGPWPRLMSGAIETDEPGNSVAGTRMVPVTFAATDTTLVMYPL